MLHDLIMYEKSKNKYYSFVNSSGLFLCMLIVIQIVNIYKKTMKEQQLYNIYTQIHLYEKGFQNNFNEFMYTFTLSKKSLYFYIYI